MLSVSEDLHSHGSWVGLRPVPWAIRLCLLTCCFTCGVPACEVIFHMHLYSLVFECEMLLLIQKFSPVLMILTEFSEPLSDLPSAGIPHQDGRKCSSVLKVLANLVFNWSAMGSFSFCSVVMRMSHSVVSLLSRWKYVGESGWDIICWLQAAVRLHTFEQLAMILGSGCTTLLIWGCDGENVISIQVSLLLPLWWIRMSENCILISGSVFFLNKQSPIQPCYR